MSLRRPLKCGVPMCLYDFLPNAYAVHSPGSSGGHFDGHLEGRVSLMLITMLVAATGANRTLHQRLFGGWAFALAFWRAANACLDVAHSAAASLAPSRRCRVSGALSDELLLVTGLAPLLDTHLRAEPCEKLHATGASPDGAGGCAASITQKDWLALYDLAEEKEEHVRLDWKGEEPPSKMHDGRALDHAVRFPILHGQAHQLPGTGEPDQPPQANHTREGMRARRLLVLVDSRVVSGAMSRGRSSSRNINLLFRKLGFWCLAYDMALE